MTDRGTYREHDGRPAVRFVRTYPHPVERVWAAVSEPDQLAHWFPSKVSIEPRAEGSIEFTGDPYAEDVTGTVLVYEPPHRLAFSWGGDELHFQLEPAEGGCTLTLIDVLDERQAAARNASGWDACLAEFGKLLAGGHVDGPHSNPPQEW